MNVGRSPPSVEFRVLPPVDGVIIPRIVTQRTINVLFNIDPAALQVFQYNRRRHPSRAPRSFVDLLATKRIVVKEETTTPSTTQVIISQTALSVSPLLRHSREFCRPDEMRKLQELSHVRR